MQGQPPRLSGRAPLDQFALETGKLTSSAPGSKIRQMHSRLRKDAGTRALPQELRLVMESTFLPRVDDHEFRSLVNLRQTLLLLAETIDYEGFIAI